MAHIEKTVFISYRHTNVSWGLLITQYLSARKYDVFLDYRTINSGGYEQVINENIKSRAHFLVLLSPDGVERFIDPNDWPRQEIEYAIDQKRNIIPIFFRWVYLFRPRIFKIFYWKIGLPSNI